MNREDILHMAHEARFYVKNDEVYSPSNQEDHELTEHLERFAKLVAEHEREACAKLTDISVDFWVKGSFPECAEVREAMHIGEAIRARGRA